MAVVTIVIIVCCYSYFTSGGRGVGSFQGRSEPGGEAGSPSPLLRPPAQGARHLLTRSMGHDAHQALHRLEQLALLALQEAGIAAGGAQAALQAGEGAALAAQQAPQPLLLAAEAGQLRLLLRLQGLHPRLQGAAGGGALGEAAVPTVQSRSLAFPWVPW